MKQLEENTGKKLQDTEMVYFFFILIKPQKVLGTKAKIDNQDEVKLKKNSLGSKRDNEENEEQPTR